MPRKTKTSQAADRELRTLPEDLIERALGAELGHHLGYLSGAANQRNGNSDKTVLTDDGRSAVRHPARPRRQVSIRS